MFYRLDWRVNAMLVFQSLAWCARPARAHAVPCVEDSNCFDGHFCDTTVFRCQECLTCQDLKREPPPFLHTCIHSVRECGPCLKGLVEDRRGELTCVPPTGAPPSADGLSSTTVVWIAAGLVIGLFVVTVAALFIRYMLKNTTIFKFKVDTNIDASLPTVQYAPTAPESPPPYSPPRAAEDLPPFRPGEDIARPLIDGYQPPQAGYEAQDRQNVSVYNAPSYVRLYNGPRESELYNDVNENYAPSIHDDDTTPSVWEPSTNYSDTNSNPSTGVVNATAQSVDTAASPTDFSTALALARTTDLIQPTVSTHRTQTQTLNGNEEATGGEGPHAQHNASARAGAGSAPANGNYNVMNVNQVITISLNPNTTDVAKCG